MKRIGILGGGQLGRMLLQVAANYPVHTSVLESGAEAPAASLCNHFVDGDIRDYETVLNFGRSVEVLTIEIENVNVAALFQLQKEGKTIIPSPQVLEVIRDKGLQKAFYQKHDIPTAPFLLTENADEARIHADFLPAAHKLRTGGYDGKGVALITNENEWAKAFNQPAILEKCVAIEKEIAVTVACNAELEMAVYPAVEMIFDPKYNLVDYQICPAALSDEQAEKAAAIAIQVVKAFQSPGMYAVEMFLDKKGNLLVNETAPRTHNSGHHTIEASYSSQFDMQMRLLLGLPLGNTQLRSPALMWNIIGAPEVNGSYELHGLQHCLSHAGCYLHLYGKNTTQPGRKLGHLTILGSTDETVALLQQLKSEVVTKSTSKI